MKFTGLKDDYGNEIKDGDIIEWTYFQHGIITKKDNGSEGFLPCVSGGLMITKEFKERKKIIYEIRGDSAGYFLDRPEGIGTTFIKEKPKCKIVNE